MEYGLPGLMLSDAQSSANTACKKFTKHAFSTLNMQKVYFNHKTKINETDWIIRGHEMLM